MEYFDPFEELLAGLKAQELKDGLTLQELAIKTGKNTKWIREKLHLLAAAGRLVVGQKRQMDLRGRHVLVPAYKIVPPRKGRST